MTQPNAQWRIDNIADIENLLSEHVVSLEKHGDQLRIRAPDGLEIILNPGDCLLRDGDRLGVMRVPDAERSVPVTRKIEVRCEQCNKPIEVDIDVLQDPATVWVVCSNECKEAYEFGLLLQGKNPSGLKH